MWTQQQWFPCGSKRPDQIGASSELPFAGIGRSAKISRVSIVGLVEALRIYLEHDEGGHFRGIDEEC